MSELETSYVTGNIGQTKPMKKSGGLLFIILLGLALFGGYIYFQTLAQAPANFPSNIPIEVLPGSSISAITKQFKQAGVVRSDLLLYFVLLTSYKPEDVKASTYLFSEPKDVYAVAETLIAGDFKTSKSPPTVLKSYDGVFNFLDFGVIL